ncbi:MAG TPA: FmdE family protein [Polyangiaceae bacterium]|nr:FmdE family protein [Polyangiaceae bacterium]
MNTSRSLRSTYLALVLTGCAGAVTPAPPAVTPAPPPTAPGAPASSTDDALARVAAIHGGAGPWAVAGYRMGAYALAKLGLDRQSFDLEVVHHTPREVQYSCIADGASAATGASAGKLNLTLVDAPESGVETTYRRKSTGQTITLRPSAAFAARFKDVPREQLAAAGKTVLGLPDADVFEEVPAPPKP